MTDRPVLLQRRVDWLQVAFRVEPDAAVLSYLTDRAELAAEHGCAEVRLTDPDGRELLLELRRNRIPGRFQLSNADVRVSFDLEAPGRRRDPAAPQPPDVDVETLLPGWTVEVIPRAPYLARVSLADALERCRAVARCFGVSRGERLRRFDLAADFAGWDLRAEEWDKWVHHPRCTLTAYGGLHCDFGDPEAPATDQTDETDEAERHYVQTRFTGFSLGKGPVRMRLYDKTAELEGRGDAAKLELEHGSWTAGGWDGAARVSRLEYQIRGEALDELILRDPSALEGMIDSVWAYLTRRWSRFVLLGTATRRSRCKLDPRWEAAQAVVFEHAASPAPRVRIRGACDFDQLYGSLLSFLLDRGHLQDVGRELRSLGHEVRGIGAMTEDSQVTVLRTLAAHLSARLETELLARWLRRPGRSLSRVATTTRAAVARFATGPPRVSRDPPPD